MTRNGCILLQILGVVLCPAAGFLGPALRGAVAVEAVPGERRPLFASEGAWCWFSDPRAVYRDGRIYAGWMSIDGSVQIGVRDEPTGGTSVVTLADKFERDDHANPALLFLPDGRLAAFYSKHTRGDMHLRVTRKPFDVAAWTADRVLGFKRSDLGRYGVTYANPVLLADERDAIYVFWRGSDYKPNFAISRDLGETWSPPRTLISRREINDDRPYMKVWSDGKSRIDFVFTDGHPRNVTTNSVYYLRYERNVFRKADGTSIGSMEDLPFAPRQCDRIYDGATAGRAWIWDIAVDGGGRPVVAYARLPGEHDHRYHYARWDGDSWRDSEVTPAGKWFPEPKDRPEPEPHYSGGIVLDPADPSTVYLSRPINGVFELERWTTADGGRTWTNVAITAGSATNNVRPFVVRQAPSHVSRVLWMNGRYRHYRDYETRIRIAPPDDSPSPMIK